MKTILLTQGKTTAVSDCDYDWLSQWKWCALKQVLKNHTIWYAVRSVRVSADKVKTVYMHREIAEAASIPQVDHHDNDGLNNQRPNLRPATACQNAQNRRKIETATSRFKGVYWDKKMFKWRAQIQINGCKRHLGDFVDEEKAASEYVKAAEQLFGEFACVVKT